jgi:hypothetical protein
MEIYQADANQRILLELWHALIIIVHHIFECHGFPLQLDIEHRNAILLLSYFGF